MAQDGSRGPQDGIKTAQEPPKTAQDGPRELQEALEESPRRQKTLIFLRFLKVFQGFACLGFRPPKTAQEASKIVQDSQRHTQINLRQVPKTYIEGASDVSFDFYL